MKLFFRLIALGALFCLAQAPPASAQYMYMDTNGDGVWSTADVLNPNGTPTTVDVYLDTEHNRDGSLAVCNTGDGDLGMWNSYAVHVITPTGTVTYSNFTNQVATFTIGCVQGGAGFASNSTEMSACQAAGAAEETGGVRKMFTVTVTGVSGTPSLQIVPLNTLDQNFTSFGTPCSSNDFDNTYILGSDWFDVDGAGPAPGGNALPILSVATTATGTEGEAFSITATASDTDASDVLTISATGYPSGLTLTTTPGVSPNTATLSGTLGLDAQGDHTITWTVNDGTNPAVTGTTVLTVTNLDQAPLVTAPANVSGAVGTEITVTVTATDPDEEVIASLTAAPLPVGANFTTNAGNTAGTLTWTPIAGQEGPFDVTFTATNSQSGSATTHFEIAGTGADLPPAVTAATTITGSEGVELNFTVIAVDPDGDAITSLTAGPLPDGATFTANATNTSGTFIWTPTGDQAGTYTVTWTASNALTGSAVSTITVENVDRPPLLAPIGDVTVAEGASATVNISATDPDGDPIQLTATLPAFGALNDPTSGVGSVVTTITLSPLAGSAGTYAGSVAVASNSLSDTKTFTITVTESGADQAPVVTAPATFNGTETSAMEFTVTASDPDGDAITSLTASPLPTGATFTANASNTSGTFSWTPTDTQSGTHNVTFTASNALSGSATTAITVSDQPQDQAPVVIAPETITGTEGVLVTFTVTASDPDGNAITSLTAAPLPAGATFTANGTNTQGTFSWTPTDTQSGTYSVTFTAMNDLTGSDVTAITIEEPAVDQAPVVDAPATVTGTEGVLLTFTVTASDPDGDAITSLTAAPLPAGATFTANGANTAGTFSWTPTDTQSGTYNVTFTAANDLSGSDATAITIQEAGADQAPVVDAPATVTGTEGVLVTFTVTASDPDGDAITSLTAAPLPAGATFTANGTNTAGTFSWTPTDTQSGTYSVTFTAANDLSGSDVTAITIQDAAADLAPVVDAPATVTGTEGVLVTFTVTASDPDGDAITSLTAAPLPAGATFTANGTNTAGTFSWTPTGTQSGTYSVTFTAMNDLTGSDTTVITIQDEAADQAPVVDAPATVTGTEGVLVTFTVTASDPDGDAITSLTAAPLPAGATFTANASNTAGTFSWTPTGTQSGTYSVTFTAMNDLTGSDTTVITINDAGGGAFTATARMVGNFNAHRRFLCFHVTPTGESFDADDVDLSTLRLNFGGGSLEPLEQQTHVETGCEEDDDCEDCGENGENGTNGDCEPRLHVCFMMSDVVDLFGDQSVPDNLANATITGDLEGGGTFTATIGAPRVAGKSLANGNAKLKSKARPNPLNPRTELSFTLAEPGRVRVSLFDARGRLVKHLLNENRPAGDHVVAWDGSDSRGGRVASGVFYFRVEALGAKEIVRVTVLK